MPTVQDVSARRRAFRPLHAAGCFVIPNPWEVGSTKFLESLGFKALATTSSGAAWRQARPTGRCRSRTCWRTCGRWSGPPACR